MVSQGVEKDKLKFINFTMKEIHDSLDNLYENFVDGHYTEVKKDSALIIKILSSLQDSVEDEI
jgi:hypothetical protein|tara:strand:- start:446 stop:634 length:189 start_codon:yes stop_codon:yes gene_type:complete